MKKHSRRRHALCTKIDFLLCAPGIWNERLLRVSQSVWVYDTPPDHRIGSILTFYLFFLAARLLNSLPLCCRGRHGDIEAYSESQWCKLLDVFDLRPLQRIVAYVSGAGPTEYLFRDSVVAGPLLLYSSQVRCRNSKRAAGIVL